ncbi:adenylosuccinate synthase [Endozoicomonas sp. G2_2]|uniref:adenylosuccinate synthase n=1 Tax=Endozoicomonas sp. G2_2 TaxID=2821092 RepID=UPI001ADAB129|nr:adenylosuccinate synthase [Endozoicomonas sp. G2_2]MBO9471493.1 adenylosuccinate synthase [Endozoicomonas sp. G2_2]
MAGQQKSQWSHGQLCEIAARWLKRPHSKGGPGCKLALIEPRSGYDGEAPDAIGWRSAGFLDGTYLVEAKTSRADFLADARKTHRLASSEQSALGNWRFYLCPEGLIDPGELPPQWGLLWATRRGGIQSVVNPLDIRNTLEMREAVASHRLESNRERELFILVGMLSRIETPERLNDLLRVANRTNASLQRELDRERKANRRLRERLVERLQEQPEWATSPIARRVSRHGGG